MSWSAGSAQSLVELSLTYIDENLQEFKQVLLLSGTGVDTTTLTGAIVATAIGHLEAITNCQVSKAEMRALTLTPLANSAPKSAGNATYPSVKIVGELPFVATNPLIPSKQVRKTVGLPAPIAGKMVNSPPNTGYLGTDSDTSNWVGFLNNYLAFQYAGNGLYYNGLTALNSEFSLDALPGEVRAS